SYEYRQNRQNLPQGPIGPRGRLYLHLHALEARCPDYVELSRWVQATEDGRMFLAKWAARAEMLAWTPEDLFGLPTPPENPHPSYRRLPRYDDPGLIWRLQGCEVLAPTPMTATIRRPSGSTTTYRKSNTPTPSALGDGLDGLQ